MAGCGTYHMEYEYRNPEPYKFLIEAIQIQNPARKYRLTEKKRNCHETEI